jgi:hypothetical protein
MTPISFDLCMLTGGEGRSRMNDRFVDVYIDFTL